MGQTVPIERTLMRGEHHAADRAEQRHQNGDDGPKGALAPRAAGAGAGQILKDHGASVAHAWPTVADAADPVSRRCARPISGSEACVEPK